MRLNPEEVSYNRNAGRYVVDGKFVGNSVIMHLLDREQQELEVKLKAHTRLMAAGRITLADWQLRMAGSLKDSHLRMGVLGSGGKAQAGARQYGAIGYQLRRQFEYLDNFAQALHQGKLTKDQAIARAGLYADSPKLSFYRAEQIAKETAGFTEARRRLDAQARHCPDCIGYSTGGAWQPISTVTVPGVGCRCGQHCRCSIEYRRRGRPDPRRLNRGILAT